MNQLTGTDDDPNDPDVQHARGIVARAYQRVGRPAPVYPPYGKDIPMTEKEEGTTGTAPWIVAAATHANEIDLALPLNEVERAAASSMFQKGMGAEEVIDNIAEARAKVSQATGTD